MTDPTARLAAERRDAEAQVAALQRELAAIVDAAAEVATDDEHDPEGHTIAFERAQVSALLDAARARQAAADAAAGRLAAGRYGTCTECGQPIPAERLAARPATTTCVGCAARLARPT